MKKLLFIIMALAFMSIHSQAQNKVVKLKSDIGQGYMVMHQIPNVQHWTVTIIKRSFDAHGQYKDKTVEKNVLPNGKNYLKVDASYRLNKENGDIHYAKIEGFSKTKAKLVNHNEVITRNFSPDDMDMYIPRGPIGGVSGTTDGCSWTCDGTYYAWKIQQKLINDSNGNPTPTSYLQLESAYQYFDEELQLAIPYYRYMAQDYFYNHCWELGFSCEAPGYQGVDVIGVFDGMDNQFLTAGGLVIQEPVIGVRKRLGPWQDYILKSNNLINDPCILLPVQAIGFINDTVDELNYDIEEEEDHIPLLQCNGITPIEYVVEPDSETSPFESCMSNEPIEVDTYAQLVALFSAYYDCLSEPTASPFNTVLESLTILDLNDDDNKPVAVDISKALLADPNTTTEKVVEKTMKQFISQSDNASLICFNTEMQKGTFAPYIVDVTPLSQGTNNNANSRLAAATATQISISPNPSFESTQTISLVSGAKGACSYELHNLSGQLLESHNYDLEQGTRLDIAINTQKYAAGVLIHKFKFSDGTQKTLRSVHF